MSCAFFQRRFSQIHIPPGNRAYVPLQNVDAYQAFDIQPNDGIKEQPRKQS
jgi:predicted metalloendopeptidase